MMCRAAGIQVRRGRASEDSPVSARLLIDALAGLLQPSKSPLQPHRSLPTRLPGSPETRARAQPLHCPPCLLSRPPEALLHPAQEEPSQPLPPPRPLRLGDTPAASPPSKPPATPRHSLLCKPPPPLCSPKAAARGLPRQQGLALRRLPSSLLPPLLARPPRPTHRPWRSTVPPPWPRPLRPRKLLRLPRPLRPAPCRGRGLCPSRGIAPLSPLRLTLLPLPWQQEKHLFQEPHQQRPA